MSLLCKMVFVFCLLLTLGVSASIAPTLSNSAGDQNAKVSAKEMILQELTADQLEELAVVGQQQLGKRYTIRPKSYNCPQGRHVIFLIHGIGSDSSTFGSLRPALDRALNPLDQEACAEIEAFEYETGNHKFSTYYFAKKLGQHIDKYFKDTRAIKDNDKISFVMHSQGGIVATIWVLQSFLNIVGYHAEYANYLDAFITLSTPFWGSHWGNLGSKFVSFIVNKLKWAWSKFGLIEINEMTFGSDTIFRFFYELATGKGVASIRQKMKKVRPLSIGAVGPHFKWGRRRNKVENDIIVPVTSTRMDFIYSLSHKKNYPAGDRVLMSEFSETHIADYRLVKGYHFKLSKFYRGVGNIKSKCVSDINCSHPSFLPILRHLQNRRIPQDNEKLSKMRSYALMVYVSLPRGSGIKRKDVKVVVLPENPEVVTVGSRHREGKPLKLSKAKSIYKHQARFRTAGAIKNAIQLRRDGTVSFDTQKLLIEISAPGCKKRFVEAKVKATYSTFVHLNLELHSE